MKKLHEIPGRIRLFVPELWKKEDAIILRSYLAALDGINKCTVNQRCSSVLLIYDAKRIQVEHVVSQIEFIMQHLHTLEASEKHSLLTQLSHDPQDLQARQAGAAKKVIVFSLVYCLYKWKQAKFGKFALSQSVPWLQVSSLVTIIGGYPLLKGYYKKCTRELPGDSEDLLKQSAVFFTLARESAKGVFMLALKTLNDFIKFSADINNHSQWQRGQGDVCRLYIAADPHSPKMLTADKLQMGDTLLLSAGQFVPVDASITEGEAIIAEAEGLRIYKSGDFINSGCIVREGQVRLEILKDGNPREELDIHLDDVHQPETPYQRGITRAALSGAVLSYLFTGNSLNAIAVLLLMSPSAGNATVSSGLNNCVYRLSRQNVLVPGPNCLMGISECRNLVIHQDLFSKEIGGTLDKDLITSLIDDLEDLGLKVSILVNQILPEDLVFQNATQISRENLSHLPDQSVLVCGASNGEDLPLAYTIFFDASPTDDHADILVFERKLSDLPDILKEIWYARKVINQSLLFTQAFNIWYGANAILQPFDAFAAKSLNTTNSLVALLSNERILAKADLTKIS